MCDKERGKTRRARRKGARLTGIESLALDSGDAEQTETRWVLLGFRVLDPGGREFGSPFLTKREMCCPGSWSTGACVCIIRGLLCTAAPVGRQSLLDTIFAIYLPVISWVAGREGLWSPIVLPLQQGMAALSPVRSPDDRLAVSVWDIVLRPMMLGS